jgi:hypothetical protein
MAFKISNEQLARRRALAADLRERGRALNIAIAAFNREIAPLVQHVAEALDGYNESLERARDLADNIATAAQEAFDAKSDKWQDSDKGDQVRHWIEQWEMSLDEVAPAPRPATLGLMDTMAIGGYEPCCNVLRHYSQVKGRTAAKFAFLTAYSQFNSRRRPLNLQQNCSRFKRQSDSGPDGRYWEQR